MCFRPKVLLIWLYCIKVALKNMYFKHTWICRNSILTNALDCVSENAKKSYHKNQWWGSVYFKKTDPYLYLLRTWIYIIFIKQLLSVSKITKTLAFFLRTSGEYSKRYGYWVRIRFHNRSLSIPS